MLHFLFEPSQPICWGWQYDAHRRSDLRILDARCRIQAAGQTEQSVPGGASYALALADGRASVRADCNTCGGTLVVASQTLTIGPLLACTRAACPTMAFENTYVAILAGDSAAQLDGNALTLTSSRGLLRFHR